MNGTLLERFRWWLCRRFGHRSHMLEHDGEEVCRRCRQLLSTRYSRSKANP